jgi:hypothetical protein
MANKVTRLHYNPDLSLQGSQTKAAYVIFTPNTLNGLLYEPRNLSHEDVGVTVLRKEHT